MPLKFACPHCKKSLTVDEKLAGKNAKCPQCGAAVKIPTAVKKAAVTSAAATTSPGLSNALDELTESDFKRQSPFEAVYSPPKPPPLGDDILRRASSNDSDRQKKKSSGTPAVLVLYAVHNIIESLLLFALAVILLVAIGFLGDAVDEMPMLAAGLGLATAMFGLLATIMMVTGIGLLTKRLWGYAVATAAYCFFTWIYVASLISSIGDRNRLIGSAISLIISLLLTSYFFRRPCRNFYKLKSWQLTLIAAGVGSLLGLILGGLMLALGWFESGEALAADAEGV